jgi:SAM-dependent methyltransferase
VNAAAHQLLLQQYANVRGPRKAENFDWAVRNKLFAGVDLEGRTLLDVGCGTGHIGLWAAAHGARRVVGLEPQVEGSSAGMQDSFRRTTREVGLEDRVELVTTRLQDYHAGNERFDVVLLAASINHLDEDACGHLHEDEQARQTYREHLRLLADMAVPGAILIVTDCARGNLFHRLGMRNPLTPTIEWEKHQSPELWARLLADVGFEAPTVDWMTLNTLRGPGQALLGNRACAYLTTSTFRLTMRRRSDAPS